MSRYKDLTKKQRGAEQLLRRQLKYDLYIVNGPLCALCGKPIRSLMNDASIDHIIPFSKGGATNLVNCQLVHNTCNAKRGDTDLELYKKHHDKQ